MLGFSSPVYTDVNSPLLYVIVVNIFSLVVMMVIIIIFDIDVIFPDFLTLFSVIEVTSQVWMEKH